MTEPSRSPAPASQYDGARILVVEDEQPIAEIVRFHLERNGFATEWAWDGEQALGAFERFRPALVILDVMLPKLDGFEVGRRIRSRSDCPIIILTARDTETDAVAGFELGADDYVTKPFSPRELVHRVRAVLRRSGVAAEAKGPRRLSVGPIELDPAALEAYREDRPLGLSPREFELLHWLASHPGQVWSREALLERVWGYAYTGDARTVDVTVRRLREKIEDDPSRPAWVLTRRGAGYYCPRS